MTFYKETMNKKFHFHFACIVLTIVAAAGLGKALGTFQYSRWIQQYAEMEQPKILANVPLVKYEKNHDFGILSGSVGTLQYEFTVTNTGLGPLKLGEPQLENESVQCLLSSQEIEPNQSMTVTISCTPTTSEGDFDYSVYIPTNAPTEPELEFSVQGTIHPEVWTADSSVEVAGVPTLNVFKTSNRVFSLQKNEKLQVSNLHVTDAQYADFFSFETAEIYGYEMSEVVPAPESGIIVTIAVKPGIPNKIFTVTVEGETNNPEIPKIQFNIDFKAPEGNPIPGISEAGLLPQFSSSNSNEISAPPSSSENIPASSEIPEKIELEQEH